MGSGSRDRLVETKVLCPHCWHRFYSDDAMYISRHAELYGDPVLGDQENRRFAPHDVRKDRDGNALDPKGWKMVERACPVCRLQIPPTLLARPATIISIVGAPRSGKTYFLTSMIHELRTDLAKYFAYSLHDSDSHDVRAFLEFEHAMFSSADPQRLTYLRKTEEEGGLYNKVVIDGAEVLLPKPFIFSMRPTEVNIDLPKHGDALFHELVLYDNAGESFDFLKEKSARNRVTQHLGACDAVMFVLDPLQEPQARQRLAASSHDPQLTRAATTNRQQGILQEMINRMRRHRNGKPDKRLDVSLAVCVQKYDVWRTLLPHVRTPDGSTGAAALIDHSSIQFIPQYGMAGLDVEEINLVSLLVRAFVYDLCPDFVLMAEAQFSQVRYFPVSALGTSPEYDTQAEASGVTGSELLKVRPMNLRPFRVTHPMLWLFHRWQLIRRVRSRTDNATKYPHAKVLAVMSDRIRVQMPSGALLMLDKDYCGGTIVDPQTGDLLWLPPVSESAPKAAEAAAPTAPPPKPAPKLMLNEQPPPPKRGWFNK